MSAGEKDPSERDAESLYDEFLKRRDAEQLAFPDFVDRYPRFAEALRALHSMCGGDIETTPSDEDETGDVNPLIEKLGADGKGASIPEALLRRERIENFTLHSILGEGGFGVVFEAEQLAPVRRTVALKVLKLGMDSREVVARFEAERQALALMNHPSIAKIFEAGLTDTGRPYFAMEHIAGDPITAYAEEHSLSIQDRLALFIPVCEAIQHAHQKAVIHRDIKPSNVLVTVEDERPVPKVIDFGVAKATRDPLTDKTLFTEAGQMIGTPIYMSPEQFSGLDIDTRSDIYALGALLYELLTGNLPFDPEAFRAANYAEVERILRQEDPPLPSTRVCQDGEDPSQVRRRESPAIRRQLRGDLDWIVMKAMAKDRTRRYATASELAADIQRHLNHEPVVAGPPGLGYRLGKLVRRHRTKVVISLTALLSLLAIAVGLWISAASAYRSGVAATRSALDARDLPAARSTLAVLLEAYPETPAVKALAVAVDDLEETLLSQQSGKLVAEARADWDRYRAFQEEEGQLRVAWKRRRRQPPLWAPPWERADEFTLHDSLQRVEKAGEDAYDSAALNFQRAIEIAPPDSAALLEARRSFARLFRQMYDTALADGRIAFKPDFFRRQGVDLDAVAFGRRGGSVSVTIDPPDAAVYCFRFETVDRRLLPIPHDPSDLEKSATQRPALIIEWVAREGRSPFQVGDRFLEVKGRAVETMSDLAEILETVAVDAPVDVLCLRQGDRVTERWIPYPKAHYRELSEENLIPGKVRDTRRQFAFSFAGYPLAFLERFRLNTRLEARNGQLHLGEGSYLFVARKPGYLEFRYPVHMTGRPVTVKGRLLKQSDVPPGYVHIPGGTFFYGGDPEAFQGLPPGEADVDDFLMDRFEVTFGAYKAFLKERIDPNKPSVMAAPVLPEVKKTVARYAAWKGKLPIVPIWNKRPCLIPKDGEWVLSPDVEIKSETVPLFGISHLAALEYAHWLTQRQNGAWRFRLPTDLQWEKAARGADRRHFVWGNYPMWCYAWTHRGIYRRKPRPEVVGMSPTDESVYGVRDLTGSVSEHARGRPSPPYNYRSIRGGNWYNTDEYTGRAATRNGFTLSNTGESAGFRLVAERQE